jgi:hypothetical protein
MKQAFIFGVIGFCGFEGLRIYKCLWGGHPILPLSHKYFYFSVLLIVASFSGAISTALSHGNIGEAIYVGFSVPTGIKALLDRPDGSRPQRKSAKSQDYVDDISLRSPRFSDYLLNHYFQFR